MNTSFKVKGQKELSAFFSAMPVRLQKNAARAGVTAAAAVFRDRARELAPKGAGKLAKGIRSGGSRVNRDGTVTARVRLEGPHAFLGLMFEFGVAPHLIGQGKAGESVTMRIGKNYFEGPIRHPGLAPHPFMRPALDSAGAEALRAFGDKIRENLHKRTGFTVPSISVEQDY